MIVFASCATVAPDCQDTMAVPGVAWLEVPVLVIAVIAVVVIAYFGATGSRGT